ncbi:MAG TPA: hypothetical protein VH592_16060 [Gemmataceae bacterium]
MGLFIPRGGRSHGGRTKAVRFVLLACVLFVAAPVGSFAQTSENTRTYYLPARSFDIPFSIPQNDPGIEEILNVSTDGQTYRYVATARPIDRRFHFTAPADGWYSFIVQTRDASGALTPENLRGVAPNIRVCVDTQNPAIESFTADASSDSALPTIRWKIVEPNLKEVLADYRSTTGGDWVPLFLPAKEEGAHPWKPYWSGELEVRMMAIDKAERRSEVRTVRLSVGKNVTRMPPSQDQAGTGKVLFVRSKTFQLNYTLDDQTVGPSDVASVDIWKLHPGPGQGWIKCAEKGKRIGPATVSVESAGRWGFRLIPVSGVGMKERDPLPGDTPDIWVEVDDRPPLVKITNVTVTQEADGGYLTIYWKADDAFLHSMPITIFLGSTPKGGDWNPVAKGLPNTGHWRQKLEDLNLGARYEFELKVSATDEAGNTGENQWHDTVKTDLRIPRIKHIEVKPDGAAASGQQPYGSAGTPPIGGLPFDNQPSSKQAPSPNNAKGTGFNLPGKLP